LRLTANYGILSNLFFLFYAIMLEELTAATRSLAAGVGKSQPPRMPTAEQLRAARAMLGWSMEELAARSGVSARTIARCETGEGVPLVSVRTLRRLVQAYEREGIEFTQNGQGVRLRRR
jgi:DNA-binding XRE family transcriptional regulator